jgi:hypothetical protein
MKEKIKKEFGDIEKKALKTYIGKLEKETKFLKLAVISLIVGGAFLNIHYPIWHIKFWLELFINSGATAHRWQFFILV